MGFNRFSFQMIRNNVVNQSVRCSDDSGGELFVHDIETIRYQDSLLAFSFIFAQKNYIITHQNKRFIFCDSIIDAS